MNKYHVHILSNAQQNLLELYSYVAETDSTKKAEYLLTKIEELCLSLEHFPERGHVPEELQRVAITNFRELHFKPYRIFYQIIVNNVYIHCIIDGRRDLESFLLKQLLNQKQ